ncbi:FHA domain-containing protein, partial [Cardiosporidium cionae]
MSSIPPAATSSHPHGEGDGVHTLSPSLRGPLPASDERLQISSPIPSSFAYDVSSSNTMAESSLLSHVMSSNQRQNHETETSSHQREWQNLPIESSKVSSSSEIGEEVRNREHFCISEASMAMIPSQNGKEISEGDAPTLQDPAVSHGLLSELTCSICLEYFHLPVTLSCGHTYCRYCVGSTKLPGKRCPLCRQPIGNPLCINTVLTNLIEQMSLKRAIIPNIPFDPENQKWWPPTLSKPLITLPLFLRILVEELSMDAFFLGDLIACIIDLMEKNKKWSHTRWMIGPTDFEYISEIIGFDKTDEKGSSERLQQWVEHYVRKFPEVCFHESPEMGALFKIAPDKIHRVTENAVCVISQKARLPWDCGRHDKSLIRLPHSSVSLNHLLFVKGISSPLGLIDCDSTIGTVMRIKSPHILKNGDIIHLGDRVLIKISFITSSSSLSSFVWNSSKQEIVASPDKLLEEIDNEEIQRDMPPSSSLEMVNADENSHQEKQDTSSSFPSPPLSSLPQEESFLPSSTSFSESLEEKAFSQAAQRATQWELFREGLPLESMVLLKFQSDGTEIEVDPRGAILGRGKSTPQLCGFKKIQVTSNDGWISREHCMIRYDGSRPPTERWILEDKSTLGTFIKLPPFNDPIPLAHGDIFKVGQCRVEVAYDKHTNSIFGYTSPPTPSQPPPTLLNP